MLVKYPRKLAEQVSHRQQIYLVVFEFNTNKILST